MPESAVRDLVLASITIKYTQSNSVAYAVNGQIIGVGAGQQSRVDCVKLAGRKVSIWWCRQHPKVQALQFKEGSKRQDRVNARVRYIEGDITEAEMPIWLENFAVAPEPLTAEEKAEWMATLDETALSSDAFFPFRDSIDHASKFGVKYVLHIRLTIFEYFIHNVDGAPCSLNSVDYSHRHSRHSPSPLSSLTSPLSSPLARRYIAQAGGSVQDTAVAAACDEYGMAMCLTGLRLFHH